MDDNKYESLIRLARDKTYYAAIRYLVNNEKNEDTKIEYLKKIANGNVLLATEISNSFYNSNTKLKEAVDAELLQRFHNVNLQQTNKHYLYLLYFSLLSNNNFDEACLIVEELIKRHGSKMVFEKAALKEHFDSIWLLMHLCILIKYRLESDVRYINRICPDNCEIDKKKLAHFVVDDIKNEKTIDKLDCKVIIKFKLGYFDEILELFNKYNSGNLGKMNFSVFRCTSFVSFCKEMGYDESVVKDGLGNRRKEFFERLKNEYGKFLDDLVNEKNESFISQYKITNKLEKEYCKIKDFFITRFCLLLQKLDEKELIVVRYSQENVVLEIYRIDPRITEQTFYGITMMFRLYCAIINNNNILPKLNDSLDKAARRALRYLNQYKLIDEETKNSI